MKIVYLVGSFPKLSETFILNQITGLIDRGYEIEIVACHNPKEEKVHEDVITYNLLERTHYIQYKDEKSLLNTSNVRQLVSCLDADIIHVHFATRPADVALDIQRKTGIPYIITAHAYDIFVSPDIKCLRAKFHVAKKVVTVSQFNRKYLLELLGQEFAEKIEVQYIGIDLDKFKFISRRPKERTTLLFIGRLVEKKGVLDAIGALRYVVEKHPAVELRIIGEGPQKEEAQLKIEELKITDNVKFLGSLTQDDVTEEMERADIFFLPSATALNGDREGLPVVVLEAQAVGLPVVSTRHTGIPEAVIDGETGFLLEEHDTRGMARRICELIENPDLPGQMGLAGRKAVEVRHDLGSEIDRLERLIKDTFQLDMRHKERQDRSGVEYDKRVSRYYAEVMERLEGQIRQQEVLLAELYGFVRRIQRTVFYRIYRRILELSR